MSKRWPLFIIGNPRSGTSLLRSLLNAHPGICIAPECGFLLWLKPKWKDVPLKDEKLEEFIQDVLRSRKFHTWNLSFMALKEELMQRSGFTFQAGAMAVYKAYARSKGKPEAWVGDKNNYYISHCGALLELWPSSTFIHIVRDVRDVTCSYRELAKKELKSTFYPNLDTEPARIAEEWLHNNREAMRVLDSSTQYFRVRYEDMVSDPTHTLKSLYEQIGLAPQVDLSPTMHLTNLDEPQEFMDWKAKLKEPVNNGSVGRFEQALSGPEIKEIEKIAGPLMAEFGYSPYQGPV
jgi:hypothetical protein